MIREFVECALYENHEWYLVNFAIIKLGIRQIPTGGCIYLVRRGCDPKGPLSILEEGVMGGRNTADIGIGVFSDPVGWRKSDHLPHGRHIVFIREFGKVKNPTADIWKIFISDGELDSRTNYGQTRHLSFGCSRKAQHSNI